MDSAERLLAIEAIKVLKARYFRFVDTKAWTQFVQLFAPDATLFFPENDRVARDIAAFMQTLPDALAGSTTIHHGHMPEIEVLTPDTARGIWAMTDYLYFPPGTDGLGGAATIRGAGHYHETYVRLRGAWLFRSIVLTRLQLNRAMPTRSVGIPPGTDMG